MQRRKRISLLPEQGKSVEFYFISAHSFLDLLCATSSNKDECDIIYLCKYIQFKFTSRTHQCSLNGTYVRFELKSWWNILWCPLRRALTVQIEQTPEVMRETYKCAEWGGGLELRIAGSTIALPFQNTLPQRRLWSRLLFAEYCQSKASRFHWDLNSDRWIQSPEC